MILTRWRGPRTAVWIYGTHEQHLLDAFCDRSVERLTHQHWMQLEIIVRNTYQVDCRVSTTQSCSYGRGIVRVPHRNLCQRIGSKDSIERGAIAANRTIALTSPA